jgi:hypothetical protein
MTLVETELLEKYLLEHETRNPNKTRSEKK